MFRVQDSAPIYYSPNLQSAYVTLIYPSYNPQNLGRAISVWGLVFNLASSGCVDYHGDDRIVWSGETIIPWV